MELILANFLTTKVIIAVPLIVKLISHEADIVTKAECTIVVDNSVQIVQRLNLECVLEEFCIATILGRIKVPYREIDEILQLSPLVSVQTESFELNYENGRWDEEFHAF